MCVRTSRRAPARRPCSPASRASGGRAGPRARGAGAWPRSAAGRCPARTSHRSSFGRGVGAVGDAAAGAGEVETAWVGRKCGTGLEADRERADPDGCRRGRTPRARRRSRVVPRSSRRPRTGAGTCHAPPGGASSRGRGGSSVPGGRRPAPAVARRIGERRGERHEVQDVVGVQVRDHDRVDLAVVDDRAELAEHAAAAVEQQAGAAVTRRDSRCMPLRRPARQGTCPGTRQLARTASLSARAATRAAQPAPERWGTARRPGAALLAEHEAHLARRAQALRAVRPEGGAGLVELRARTARCARRSSPRRSPLRPLPRVPPRPFLHRPSQDGDSKATPGRGASALPAKRTDFRQPANTLQTTKKPCLRMPTPLRRGFSYAPAGRACTCASW